jgi:Mrp family chromosome partitioning ATPase
MGLALHGRRTARVAVTSLHTRDGRSLLAANLAWVLGRTGRRVTLVDADLRHPAQRWYLGVGADGARSDTSADRSDCVIVPGNPAVSLVTIDDPALHPAEIAVVALPNVIRDASADSDVVVIDAPALAENPEALGIVVEAEAAILVVKQRGSDPAEVRRWVGELRGRKVEVLGVVINRQRRPVRRLTGRRPPPLRSTDGPEAGAEKRGPAERVPQPVGSRRSFL